MTEKDIDIVETSQGVRRRTVIKGAAWSIPVIAAAVATPAATASTSGGGEFESCTGATWVDDRESDGWIAQCIVFTLRDATGQPDAGTSVRFMIEPENGPFFFVDDPTYDELTAIQLRDQQRRDRILTTDDAGQIPLDGLGVNDSKYGWIRKGPSSTGETSSTLYAYDVNSGQLLGVIVLNLGGTDPGLEPGL